jgi:predicted transcriptional regulator YdeE
MTAPLPAFLSTLAALVLTAFAPLPSGDTMAPKIVQQPAFTVVGIAVRTDNSRESGPGGMIPRQWQRFVQDGIAAKIPNKVDDKIYVVYSNYESDYHGSYDYLIGVRVSSAGKLPADLTAVEIRSGQYAVVTSAQGPVWQVVPDVWKQIWSLEDKDQLGGKRAYATDFEVYDERARDPQNSQIDVYLGLRPKP